MRTLTLKTTDGHDIAVAHYQQGNPRLIIFVHGFFVNKDVALFREMAEDFKPDFDVISFDLRGHGKSGGLFSWTAMEPYDLEQVLEYARGQGYEQIGVLGFSLGAAVSMITASKARSVKSLAVVSPPTDLWKIDFRFWEPDMIEDLKMNISAKGRGKGVRPGHPFRAKARPVDVVADISPTPLLLIHGENDWLIKPSHSRRLFKKAKSPKRLEIVAGAGHAERIYASHGAEFMRLCREWFEETLPKIGDNGR